MEFSQEQADTLASILNWRRDVRHFRIDPVPDTLMDRLRDATIAAPSVGNARPWRVIRVRDTALRQEVRTEFARCNAAAAQAYDDVSRAEYGRLKLAGLEAAPEHLAVFTKTDPAEGRGLGRQTMPATLRQSTAMAIHTMWLVARAANLGMGMVSILDPKAIERIFSVPNDWEFSAYLCVGWPEFMDDTPLLHRAGWQENRETFWEDR